MLTHNSGEKETYIIRYTNTSKCSWKTLINLLLCSTDLAGGEAVVKSIAAASCLILSFHIGFAVAWHVPYHYFSQLPQSSSAVHTGGYPISAFLSVIHIMLKIQRSQSQEYNASQKLNISAIQNQFLNTKEQKKILPFYKSHNNFLHILTILLIFKWIRSDASSISSE